MYTYEKKLANMYNVHNVCYLNKLFLLYYTCLLITYYEGVIWLCSCESDANYGMLKFIEILSFYNI